MKYTVNIKEVHNLEVIVDANSPEEAREKANDVYPSDCDFDNLVFAYTLPKENWTVNPIP